jgi:hypothetical protein
VSGSAEIIFPVCLTGVVAQATRLREAPGHQ